MRAPERADVRLGDAELAARQRAVDAFGHGAEKLCLGRPAGVEGRRRPELHARHLVPAKREVRPHVAEQRAFDANRRVVPAELAARAMLGRVPPVARERREVDAADVRDLVVDDDRLLVVTVHRPLAVVQRDADAGASSERVAHRPNVAARGLEERQRRARPCEDANLDALRELGEELAERLPILPQLEPRREVPPRDEHRRLGALQVLRDPRQRFGSVDEHLERAAAAGLRLAVGPARFAEGVERGVPPDSAQPPPVVRDYDGLDCIADDLVQPRERTCHRNAKVSRKSPARTR